MTTVSTPTLRQRLATSLVTGQLLLGDDDASIAQWLDLIQEEGVQALLEKQLRTCGHWDAQPQALRDALSKNTRAALVRSMLQEQQLHQIVDAARQADVRVMLLKGNALGLWLYADPYLRETSDIDLLFASKEELGRVVAALAPLHYVAEPDAGAYSYERKCILQVNGSKRGELDMHSRLLNAPLYAELLDFDTLWQAAIPLGFDAAYMRALGVEHALVHACLNRALNIQNAEPDQLKLLFDIHLLMARMDAQAWAAIVALVTHKRICGVCLRSIEDAATMFGTKLPPSVIATLQRNAATEPLDARRLQDWRYMQWQNFKALPGVIPKLRWVWMRLFPSLTQLSTLYGNRRWVSLMLSRLWRGILRLQSD